MILLIPVIVRIPRVFEFSFVEQDWLVYYIGNLLGTENPAISCMINFNSV